MNKRKTRCYIAYCDAGGIFNNEVFYTVSDHGYGVELATCINCGALFVLDRENPKSSNRSLSDLADKLCCPECDCDLHLSIRRYPDTFVGKGGHVGSFRPSNIIPPDEQSCVVELWELAP
jgi:hypothetical protein